MTIDTKRRLRTSLLISFTGLIAVAGGFFMTAGMARAMAGPAAVARTPPQQGIGSLDAFRGRNQFDKHQRFSRSNTDGVEFRWRVTPDGWLDVFCNEVVLEPPYDQELIVQRHPAVAELRIAGVPYPLQTLPSGSLAVRVPASLFGIGLTRVDMLAWESTADPTDDSQAFIAKGAKIRR